MSSQSTLTQIEDDIYQLRLPLPFALNHVNVYLLHSSNGWTIVDCGINWDKGRQAWQQASLATRPSTTPLRQRQ